MSNSLKSSEIASHLNLELVGKDVSIHSFSQLSNIQPNTVVFAKKYNDSFVDLLNAHEDIFAIVTKDYQGRLKCPHVLSKNPRLDYIKVLTDFFEPVNPDNGKIDPTAVIKEGAVLGKNVTIGANCYVGPQVVIGDNTIIHPNVVIDNIVSIGHDCEIKSGTVIGQSGFGFERNENGDPIRFPHLGKVLIGNYVSIGANNTVDRATLGATIMEDYVKTDNLVHIAHNDVIKYGSLITAGAIFSGGVTVGEKTWVAPNTCFMQQITIGSNVTIGLGAVVLKNVDDNAVMVGNPAHKLEKK